MFEKKYKTTYKSTEISPSIFKSISNYTKSIVNDRYVKNIVFPNSIKYIKHIKLKNNMYPNSIIIIKDNKIKDKYTMRKIINNGNNIFKNMLNAINIHTLSTNYLSIKKASFLDNVIMLLFSNLSHINLSKINNLKYVYFSYCKKIKNILKLRNIYLLKINSCQCIKNNLILKNIYTLSLEHDEYINILCNVYKLHFSYFGVCCDENNSDDESVDESVNNKRNNNKNIIRQQKYKMFTKIYAYNLHLLYINLQNVNNICYANILKLYSCSCTNITNVSYIHTLHMTECYGYEPFYFNFLNKNHTLFLSDYDMDYCCGGDDIVVNISCFNKIHTLTINNIGNVIITKQCNLYNLQLNNDDYDSDNDDCNSDNGYQLKNINANIAKLNAVKHLTIGKKNEFL